MKNWSYTITDKEHPHYGETLWSGRYCTCTAFVLLIDRTDRVFILANKRGSGAPDYQGYWNCPCGYIEADEDLKQVTSLIKNIEVEYFNCGHGIHSEKPKEFMRSVNETLRK